MKLRNIYISSDRTNLDPGFGRGIFSKLFEAPFPLSKLRSIKAQGVLAYGSHEAFVLILGILYRITLEKTRVETGRNIT